MPGSRNVSVLNKAKGDPRGMRLVPTPRGAGHGSGEDFPLELFEIRKLSHLETLGSVLL